MTPLSQVVIESRRIEKGGRIAWLRHVNDHGDARPAGQLMTR